MEIDRSWRRNFQHCVLWLDGASVAYRTNSRVSTALLLAFAAKGTRNARAASSWVAPGEHAVDIGTVALQAAAPRTRCLRINTADLTRRHKSAPYLRGDSASVQCPAQAGRKVRSRDSSPGMRRDLAVTRDETARRRLVWNPTITMVGGSWARQTCKAAAAGQLARLPNQKPRQRVMPRLPFYSAPRTNELVGAAPYIAPFSISEDTQPAQRLRPLCQRSISGP